MCWQLDPTEGPCRERRRLMRVPRNIDDKYILDEGIKSNKQGNHGDVRIQQPSNGLLAVPNCTYTHTNNQQVLIMRTPL